MTERSDSISRRSTSAHTTAMSSPYTESDALNLLERAMTRTVSFRQIKSPPSIAGDFHSSEQPENLTQSLGNNWASLKPKQENYQSALGINFDRPKKIDSPSFSNYNRSPSLDIGDTGFQPISRTNTFELYRNNNNSDSSITASIFNGASNANTSNTKNNLSATISNLTFSPLSTTRTNNSDNNVASPKEKTTPLQKARLLAQKAKASSNRDFLPKRKTSTVDDTEVIRKGLPRKNSLSSASIVSGAKAITENKKKIFPDLSSLSKPRISATSDLTLRRSSSESTRIPTTINELNDSASTKSHSHLHHRHHHHHHHLLRRKDVAPNVLSSSSSNSKLISDYPALYNFHPSANTTATNDLLKIVESIENEMMTKTLSEDKRSDYADRLLHLLFSCVLPLFKGDVLATPIEDLNRLVETFLMVRINKNDVKNELNNTISDANDIPTSSDAKAIIKEFQDLIKVGISLMQNQSNIDNLTHKDSKLNKFGNRFSYGSTSSFSESTSSFGSADSNIPSQYNMEIENEVAALWDFFLHDILSYLEAIFFPLQMEFDGCGIVLNNPNIAKSFWSQLLIPEDELSVKRFILLIFRDSVIIPMVEKLGNVNNFFAGSFNSSLLDQNRKQDDLYPQKLCLLQCFGVLSTAQSKDYNQKVVETLLDVMKKQIKI